MPIAPHRALSLQDLSRSSSLLLLWRLLFQLVLGDAGRASLITIDAFCTFPKEHSVFRTFAALALAFGSCFLPVLGTLGRVSGGTFCTSSLKEAFSLQEPWPLLLLRLLLFLHAPTTLYFTAAGGRSSRIGAFCTDHHWSIKLREVMSCFMIGLLLHNASKARGLF